MTEMFEKVARALAAVAEQHSFLGAYAACGKEMTKAAIEAMREPTDEMVDAGRKKSAELEAESRELAENLGEGEPIPFANPIIYRANRVARTFVAMIDAALEGKDD